MSNDARRLTMKLEDTSLPTATGAPQRRDLLARFDALPPWAIPLGLVVFVIATRLPLFDDFDNMWKDGWAYIRGLELGPDYPVPQPGNPGLVLIAKALSWLVTDPVYNFKLLSVAMSCVSAVMTFAVGALFLPRSVAAAAALALASSPMFWFFGVTINSYMAWAVVLPTLAWFVVRYSRERRLRLVVGASVTLGVGTVLRPDLLWFGGPLWLGGLILARAPLKHWLLGTAIVGTFAAACLLFMVTLKGGLTPYLAWVEEKRVFLRSYSPWTRGLFEGLARNALKYGLALGWSAHLALLPLLIAFVWSLRRLRERWRWLLLAMLWVVPSWYFSFFEFFGTPGLILPFLPLVYLGAAAGLYVLRAEGRRVAFYGMLAFALAGAAQFTLTPLLEERNQRDVILNVTFSRYTAQGIAARYFFNLSDYGIDPSASNMKRQLRDPGPLGVRPQPRSGPPR